MKLHLPPGLDPGRFLEEYWQRRPLLMRGALREYDFPLSPEELAGLACEAELESRLVLDHGNDRWELRHGPFDEETFLELPGENWTLLVQDVDKFLPEVARLLEPFRFLPAWRFDDVMISYAAPGGSVGPHIDTYDVFLVQGTGRRRWRIQRHPRSEALLPGLPVRILAEFEPDEEWVLEAGDVLYLPPGVAHWGVAETPTMNWSVGLRAPALQEMLDSFAQFLLERMPEEDHYRDPPMQPAREPGRIPAPAVTRTFGELDRWLGDEALRQQWFGAFMTEVKPHLAIEPPDAPLTPETLDERMAGGARLRRHPFARFAWSERKGGGNWLFVSGEAYAVTLPGAFLEHLCSAPFLAADDLPAAEQEALTLLAGLVNLGQLELESG